MGHLCAWKWDAFIISKSNKSFWQQEDKGRVDAKAKSCVWFCITRNEASLTRTTLFAVLTFLFLALTQIRPRPEQLFHLVTCFFVSQSLSRACPCLVPQGLFRLAAAASVVKRLKTCLDQGVVDHSDFSMEPHAVAGNDSGETEFLFLFKREASSIRQPNSNVL